MLEEQFTIESSGDLTVNGDFFRFGLCVCLQVNGVDITGVGQEELVCMLRSTRQGESVCLVVLRQEDMFLPREMVRTNHSALVSASDQDLVGCDAVPQRSGIKEDDSSVSYLSRPAVKLHHQFSFLYFQLSNFVISGPINRLAWMMHNSAAYRKASVYRH